MSSRTLATAVALVAAIATAGCASVAASQAGAPRSAGATSATSSGSPATDSLTSHQSIATHDAARILAAFRPPAGAHQLKGEPAGVSPLDDAAVPPEGGHVVRDTQWWSTGGSSPQKVIEGIATPTGAQPNGSMASGGPGASTYTGLFMWPMIDGVLLDRWLDVSGEFVNGVVILRVDAMVKWLPPRPADTLIPVNATSVTATYRPGSLTLKPAKPYAPVTSTDPTVIAAFAKTLNLDPIDDGLAVPCPSDMGARLLLVFRGPAGDRGDSANIELGGCARITVQAGTDVTLDGGWALAEQVQKALHQNWHVS